MNKRLFLLVPVLVALGLAGWLVAQKQTVKTPTRAEQTAAAAQAAPASTPTTTVERLIFLDPSGTRRQLDVTNQTGQSPLPPLKALARQGQWLAFASTGTASKTNTVSLLDETTKILRQTPIPVHLVIGYANGEVFFFRSTRYAPSSYRTELNEIGAYNVQTGQERTLDTLSEHFSFAKQVEGAVRLPKGKATLTATTVRAEVYFEGAYLFPGQERLPIEIHTLPLAASSTSLTVK